jgi:outer membrane receptor protein involved in Fe transport
VKYRYFGAQPLTEDGALKGPATGVVNARVGYRWDNGWSVRADVFNMFGSRSDQITYGYGSLFPTDPLFPLNVGRRLRRAMSAPLASWIGTSIRWKRRPCGSP